MENEDVDKGCCHQPVSNEEKLAKIGAGIDKLIEEAVETRVKVTNQVKCTQKSSTEALHDLRLTLDKAWEDLSKAFDEMKEGTEKAANKLLQKTGS